MTMPCYPQGCAAGLQSVRSSLAATPQQGWGCKPRPPMRAMPTTPGTSHNNGKRDNNSHRCQVRTALRAGQWQPGRTVVVTHPKTREIHAPAFADRVVHHLLVERLEPLYEPVFIHDSFANRRGKGSHAAVDRLQAFMRARANMVQGGGWSLQLDIHNYWWGTFRYDQTKPVMAQLDALKPRVEKLAKEQLKLMICPNL